MLFIGIFSLERVWCRALINGSRTAPCVAGKTNSGMIVSRCGQLLVYLSDFGPSSFVSLSQPFRKVSLQTQRGLTALPASMVNVLNPRFPSVDVNSQGLQVPLADIVILIA